MTEQRRKFWGWGLEHERASDQELDFIAAHYRERFAMHARPAFSAPRETEFDLPASRLKPPDRLAGICRSDPYERLLHTYGKSFPDTLRMHRRQAENPPDIVAYPRTEDDIAALMDWAATAKAALIPFGGGSSVVGGVEARVGAGHDGVISLDMQAFDRVLEVDRASRSALIQGGMRGPALEATLREHGLTLRHFPQSFEHSTLGGWIATRSGGHYASLFTHIDELVAQVRLLSPAGIVESRRLPGSGAGPSPDRFLIGSEGAFGVITQAWMRLQDRPTFRESASIGFDDLEKAVEAVRALSQSWLFPTNCRLLDREEAAINGAGDGSRHVLVLGFESADHPLEAWMARAMELVRDHGGDAGGEAGDHRAGAAGIWRNAFIRMPYLREVTVGWGIINDTFETAITWDRFAAFNQAVTAATRSALKAATGHEGMVSMRFTHVYPDGPAPYYSFHVPGDPARLMEQWQEIKQRVSDAVIEAGGTITHHHAVGRDHMPWYRRQRPALFGAVLGDAKARLDPAGIMNPGVLVDD